MANVTVTSSVDSFLSSAGTPTISALDVSGDLVVTSGTSKVGIRKTPTAALDVDGTIKASDININAKGFFVGNGSNGDYLQAKDYGNGDFHDRSDATNQPKSIPAFGSNGKIIEKTLIKTIKLQGTGFTGLGTPVVLVAGVADK